jgi:hypothetical protein
VVGVVSSIDGCTGAGVGGLVCGCRRMRKPEMFLVAEGGESGEWRSGLFTTHPN